MLSFLTRRWALGLLFGVFGLLVSNTALAQITNIHMAINQAGHERALSQRMAKAYIQLGMQVDIVRSYAALEDSVLLFERQLYALKSFAPTPVIRASYEELERAWATYKQALTQSAPTPEGGKQVMALSELVLRLAHQATVQLEQHAGTTSGQLVNLSGRQRMLSQRMAKFYQARAWGIADSSHAQEIAIAREEFAAAHATLSGQKNNAEGIRTALALVQPQWVFFDNALNKTAQAKKESLNVATTSERIYEQLNTIVTLYEQQATRGE